MTPTALTGNLLRLPPFARIFGTCYFLLAQELTVEWLTTCFDGSLPDGPCRKGRDIELYALTAVLSLSFCVAC